MTRRRVNQPILAKSLMKRPTARSVNISHTSTIEMLAGLCGHGGDTPMDRVVSAQSKP
jgi:hypothetical protein